MSPYGGRRVVAVAPLRNESGSLHVDALRLTDQLAAEVARVRGLDTVPVNRVLATMRSLEMSGIDSPADAHRLRERLGVDGLVVGSITAYDPYDPPTLGLAVELYRGDRDPGGTGHGLDPRELSRAPRLPARPLLPHGSARTSVRPAPSPGSTTRRTPKWARCSTPTSSNAGPTAPAR